MIENHDHGDEQDDRCIVCTWCPHCGLRYSGPGFKTPVMKSLDWSSFEAKPLSNEKSYDELLECCGLATCLVKDRELARKLSENLRYKLDKRDFNLMIARARAGTPTR